jgi:hypothetical protein
LFTSATVIVNDWSVVTVPSLIRKTTLFAPVFACSGVPLSVAVPLPLSVIESHAGLVGAVIVRESPSASDVVMLYV